MRKKKHLISRFMIFVFLFSILIPSTFAKATNEKDDDLKNWITEEELIDPLLISNNKIQVLASSYQSATPPQNIIDNDDSTIWHTKWSNLQKGHELTFNLGEKYKINMLKYIPRQDGGGNGTFKKCTVKISDDGQNFIDVKTFDLIVDSKTKELIFDSAIEAQYIKLIIDGNGDYASGAEIKFVKDTNGVVTDRTKLHKYIVNAISIDKARYTTESLEDFINEVRLSVDVYNDKNSTQEDIDIHVEKVKESIKMLVKIDKPLMSFQLLSDVHAGSTKDSATAIKFLSALEEIKVNDSNSSALVFTGDVTDYAKEDQYKTFFSILDESNPTDNAIVALGNHDVRWSGGYDVVFDRYQRYYLNNINETKPYFAKEINGYTFIVLNTEMDLKDYAHISEQQLKWLDETLADQKDKNKPVFIAVHQPLKGTFPNSDEWYIGEQDTQIKHILAKYPQAIYFAGHIHNKFGTTESSNGKTLTMKYDEKYCNMLEVPSLMEHGQGYYVEVFEDKVEFLARDFVKSKWLPEYNQIVKLPVDYIPMVDLEAPTWEDAKLYGTENYRGILNLKWDVSKDNTGVIEYKILQNGIEIAKASKDTLEFKVGKLKKGKEYTFKIEARDEEGNWSNNGPEFKFTPIKNSEDLGYFNKFSNEIKNNLMAYIDFNENLTDISDNIKPSVLKGTVEYNESPFGKSGYFNGSNAVNLGLLDYGVDDFSLSFWVNSTGKSFSGGPVILSNKDFNYRQNPGYVVALTDPGTLWYNTAVTIDGSKVQIDDQGKSNITIADGTWQYLSIVTDRKNNEVNIYKNGKKQYTHDISKLKGQNMTGTNNTVIGADANGSNWGNFSFDIDEFLLVKKALNEKEIEELFNLYDLSGKSELQELINYSELIDGNLFTVESVKNLKNVINEAKDKINDSSLEERKTFINRINVALDGLVLVDANDNKAPEKLENLRLVEKTNNSIKISWDNSNNSNVDRYVIYLDGKKIDEISSENTTYNISNLKSNRIYNLKVTSKTKTNLESKPTSITIRTEK